MIRAPRTQEVLDRGYAALGLEAITQIVEIEQMLSGSMPCYDREGAPTTLLEHLLLAREDTYALVERTEVEGLTVSTVWLGQDHSFGRGPLQIFETLVFGDEGETVEWEGISCSRYSTEAEAVAGHARTLAALREVLESHSGACCSGDVPHERASGPRGAPMQQPRRTVAGRGAP